MRQYVICVREWERVRDMCTWYVCTWYMYVICVRGGQYTGMTLYVSVRVCGGEGILRDFILYIFYYFRIYSDICPLYTDILHYVYWSIIC